MYIFNYMNTTCSLLQHRLSLANDFQTKKIFTVDKKLMSSSVSLKLIENNSTNSY